MKLKHPRYSIAFNLLSILGWIVTILFIFVTPIWNKNKLGSGNSGIWLAWLFLIITTFGFIVISFIAYILELLCDVQIHNFKFPQNKIYSYFFEFGFFLYAFPIIWIWAYIDYTLLPILYLICSYILLKLVIVGIKKLGLTIKSKKQDL